MDLTHYSFVCRDSGVLITSYTGVRDQLEILLQHEWHYIVLDEGHKIRNPEAQITVALKRFTTPHRLILSGRQSELHPYSVIQKMQTILTHLPIPVIHKSV